MSKKLDPKEKVNNFINKNLNIENEKHEAGLNNSLFEWENFIEYWSLIDDVEMLIKANAELRMYNERLEKTIKLKNAEYNNLVDEYEKLKHEYDLITNEPNDDEEGWQF